LTARITTAKQAVARRRRALGIIFGSLKRGSRIFAASTRAAVCERQQYSGTTAKQVSLKLLLYCSFMSVILAHKKMFYFIRSLSFASTAVGVIHFVLQ
jgi:hypothetical protein